MAIGVSEPCPHCGVMHEVGDYSPRPDLRKPEHKGTPWAPPDVRCVCGALLRASVPVFKVNASGYVWTRVDAPANV